MSPMDVKNIYEFRINLYGHNLKGRYIISDDKLRKIREAKPENLRNTLYDATQENTFLVIDKDQLEVARSKILEIRSDMLKREQYIFEDRGR